MNKKQLKDLHSVLRSIELNEIVLSNIQQMLEKEKGVLEERRNSYESKSTDYGDDKAADLEDRIDTLEDETGGLEEIASSLQRLIELMREKVGEVEGNAIQAPYRTQAVILAEQKKKLLKDRDPLFEEVSRFVTTQSIASTSSIQRRYGIGYNRAGRIMDELEAAGIIGPSQGGKPRHVLVDVISLEKILQMI